MPRLFLDWLHIIILLGAIQGLFLTLALATRRRNRTANRLLAAAMSAFSIGMASTVYHAAGLEQAYPHFFGVSYPLPFLYGPLIYLYAVAAGDTGYRLTARDALHFAPFLAVVIIGLPVYLMSGSEFPGLTARVGINARTDVGVYFTKNPNANYGFYGAQVQRNLAQEGSRKMSAAARLSFVSLFGPEDVAFTQYGADLLASREFPVWGGRAALSPYAMVSGSLGRAREKSPVVKLEDESVFGAQATAGVEARLWKARVALEYGRARVSSFSMKVGFGGGA